MKLSDVTPDQLLEMMMKYFEKFSLIVEPKIGKVVRFKDVEKAILEKTLGEE